MPTLTLLCLGLLAFLPVFAHAAVETTPEIRQQRADFLSAEQALRRGDMAAFEKLSQRLQDYPLYPYLRLQNMQRRLDSVTPAQIADFFYSYAGSPLTERLRKDWLLSLARRDQWNTLLAQAPEPVKDTELECYRRRALYQTGRVEEALNGLQSLWLVAHSQPAICDSLFTAWRKRGGITSELAWQRFRLAMNADEIQLSRHLVSLMDNDTKKLAELWLRVYSQPRLLDANLDSGKAPEATLAMHGDIVTHSVKRLARGDLESAVKLWGQAIQIPTVANAEGRPALDRSLAISLALNNHPQALEHLSALDDELSDAAVREWRVRVPLKAQNWQGVLSAIGRMTDEERDKPDWRYWRARALEALDQTAQATKIYSELALERGYYSFLAADRIGLPYELHHAALNIGSADMAATIAHPGIARAGELYAIGRMVDARREWQYAIRDMSEEQLKSAALLAQRWDWHDRAILTMARTSERDDLELRFPLAYREQILVEAKNIGIDPGLAFAIVRQESAFSTDAQSGAGALGLMQLMPATAQRLATLVKVPAGRGALLEASTNLRLGMTYLRQLIDRFGHQAAALAGYNAGPQRVERWLPVDQAMDADIWAETIPFRETRNYVQNIMYFSAVYEHRMGLPPGGLRARMQPLIPKDARLTRNDATPPMRTIRTGS
ncbi:MAG: transglycosylase SLT domain-containing protein [Chromatiales bacterium]|jgi:soluble lytic murein transglycosylase|nr:transglycosylase SLT domain-containing protein [Chromatiales bacterium]